jgi:hypothetical protein
MVVVAAISVAQPFFRAFPAMRFPMRYRDVFPDVGPDAVPDAVQAKPHARDPARTKFFPRRKPPGDYAEIGTIAPRRPEVAR